MSLTWTENAVTADPSWLISDQDVVYSPSLTRFVSVGVDNTPSVDSILTSDDGGTSWTKRSASNQVDLLSVAWSPALSLFVAVGDADNDLSNARVMTSPTGVTWTTRTAGVNVVSWYSVCWDATDAQFLAVGGNGGNNTWTSPDGINWTGSAPNVNNWFRVTSDGAGQYVASRSGSQATNQIRYSSDAGSTWTSHTVVAGARTINGLCWFPLTSKFYIACSNGEIYSSPTGATWTLETTLASGGLLKAHATLMVMTLSTKNTETTNGSTWTDSSVLPNAPYFALGASTSGFVAMGGGSLAHYSATTASSVGISPTSGPCGPLPSVGGQTLTITGDGSNSGFTSSSRVWIGPSPPAAVSGANPATDHIPTINLSAIGGFLEAANVVINSTTELTCQAPVGRGLSTVIVLNNLASPSPNIAYLGLNAYTFNEPTVTSIAATSGVGTGGTSITLTGTNFFGPSSFNYQPVILVGGVRATSVVVASTTSMTFVTPAYPGTASNPVDVVLYPPTLHVSSGGAPLIEYAFTPLTLAASYTYTIAWWLLALPWFNLYYYSIGTPAVPSAFSGYSWALGSDPTDLGWWLSIDDTFNGAALIVKGSVPRNPRSFDEIIAFATSSTGMMGGFPGPCGVWKNHLIYAKGGYTVGTDSPPLHLFDGSFDREVAVAPATAAGVIPKAVMTILVTNGTIYFSTLDTGTNSTTWVGRVFTLDIETGAVTQLGGTFTTGHVPYALAWHLGRLWCGTHRQVSTAAGKIYFIRPGIDTTWTEDYDLATSSMAGCTSLLSYKGLLYVGCSAAAATFAQVLVRGTADTYSTSDTGSGGTAKANNAYLALGEFQGNLYASFWNPDTTLISIIRKFDNASWTLAYTGSGTSLVPFVGFPTDGTTLMAIGGGLTYSGALVNTLNGTSWNNRTTFLTQGATVATGLPAFGVVAR